MRFKLLRALLVLGTAFGLTAEDSADAQIIQYNSGTFANVVSSNNASQYSITADILEGGVLAGTINGSLTYGGGTNPFVTPNWTGGASLAVTALSTPTPEANETADGVWNFSVTPVAGFQVDGISLFSQATTLSNPTFASLTSNGTATVLDNNEGLPNEIFASQNSGAFVNGDDLVFNIGTTPDGINDANHSLDWSYDSAGATQLSFEYQVGPARSISNEGIRLDVQLSTATAAIPEPSSIGLIGLFGSSLVLRRRKCRS